MKIWIPTADDDAGRPETWQMKLACGGKFGVSESSTGINTSSVANPMATFAPGFLIFMIPSGCSKIAVFGWESLILGVRFVQDALGPALTLAAPKSVGPMV